MDTKYEKIRLLLHSAKFGQFVRFTLNGALSSAIHYGIYYVLLFCTVANVAYITGYLVSFVSNFFLTSYFTFRTKPTLKRFIGFSGSHAINFGLHVVPVCIVGQSACRHHSQMHGFVFAGNPLFISCRKLREDGLLSFSDEEECTPDNPERIDYETVRSNKEMLLRRAFAQSAEKLSGRLEEFRRANDWVNDFALFTAVKNHFGQVALSEWPDQEIRFRRPEALDRYRALLKQEIDYHIFCQYLFRSQWFALKKYCKN